MVSFVLVKEEDMVVEEHNPPGPDEQTLEEKRSIHIYLTARGHETIKDLAEYAVLEGIIEGHPRGNLSKYLEWCIQLGENTIKQYMLRKKGFQ